MDPPPPGPSHRGDRGGGPPARRLARPGGGPGLPRPGHRGPAPARSVGGSGAGVPRAALDLSLALRDDLGIPLQAGGVPRLSLRGELPDHRLPDVPGGEAVMKRLASLVLFTLAACAPENVPDVYPSADEVLAFETAATGAFLRNDTIAIDTLLTDDVTLILG